MAGFDSTNKIKVYEKNREKCAMVGGDSINLVIKNHWNIKEFVNVKFGDVELTVSASDLKKAIDNATNAHVY